jgi:hypothetical protein
MGALFATVLAWAPGADAAEWSIGPFVSVAGDYDDNAGLQSRTDEEEKISGFIGEVGADIGYRSDLYDFRAIPRLLSRRYPGDSDFDNDDQFLDYRFTRQTQNGNWGVDGKFIRDFIRTGERAYVDFEADDPEQLEDDDSGRVGARDRRFRWTVTPHWRTQLSDTSYANFRARYINVDYDQTAETLLVDYKNARAEARYNRILDPRTTALVEADALWYSAEDTPGDSTSYGLQLGVRRDLSETTSFEVLGGLSTSERVSGGNETNWIGEANLIRRLETIRLLGQFRRSITGTGSGTLTRRDQVNIAFTRRLTNLLTAGLGLLGYTTNSVEDVQFDERNYVQLRSQFIWSLTRNFDLEANYRWTLIDREDEDESANSNAITVWLHYRPNPFSISR